MKGKFLFLPIAREGVRFILPLLLLTAVFYYRGWLIPAVIFLVLSIFVIAFFRDPERVCPKVEGGIVSPADGKVVGIEEVEDALYNGKAVRVSIFLNIFNVHVNRVPVAGQIVDIVYNKGKFLNAANDKASLDNEQNSLLIETSKGGRIVVRQIAGLIARRIVCWVKKGEFISRGERFGLIRFGSRTDIFLSLGTEISVKVGDKVKGGRDLIGVLK
ncbi:MAG: phosphatidylserine decarboxylase family protein [Nitrospinota bacterium]